MQPRPLLGAADEAGEPGGADVAPGGRAVGAEDRGVQLPQRRRRVNAERFGEGRARRLVRGERLGRAAGRDERAHVQFAQPLAERMGGDE